VLVGFATMVPLENVHPLQGGILRLKHPTERRPGLPRENPWRFWPRFVWESLRKNAVVVGTIARLVAVAIRIRRDPNAHAYTDQALTAVVDDEDTTLDLLTVTTGARASIAHDKKVAQLAAAGRSNPQSRAPLSRRQPSGVPAE
jgi:hypothetical protein